MRWRHNSLFVVTHFLNCSNKSLKLKEERKQQKKYSWKGFKKFFFNCFAFSPTQVALTSVFSLVRFRWTQNTQNHRLIISQILSRLIKILIGLKFTSTSLFMLLSGRLYLIEFRGKYFTWKIVELQRPVKFNYSFTLSTMSNMVSLIF